MHIAVSDCDPEAAPVTISRGVNQQRVETMIWAGGSTVG
jgi:hypothetical protein